MAQQTLNNGDSGLQFRTKANENFTELYTLKAPLASPTFTGTPAVPTADLSTNTTQAASTAFVRAAIAALVDSSPVALDTLNELAAALGDDPNFATTITTALAGKQATLVSGTNIKTLRTVSVLGSGDISINTVHVVTSLFDVPVSAIVGDLVVLTGTSDRIYRINAVSPSVSLTELLATPAVHTQGATTVLYTLNAMGALAISTASAINTKSISTDVTMTFSAAPTTGTMFALRVTNTDSSAHTVTIPSSFSYARQSNITSFVVPANGKAEVSWHYDGSIYTIYGDPVATSGATGKYVLVDDSTPPTNGQVLTWDNTAGNWEPSSPAGGGDALTSGTLAQFASTTSSQLAGVISDETGSGALVFATSPTLVTPALGAASATSIRFTETTSTPSGTTQTITLANGNHQTLSLTSTSGNPTITLTVPASSANGTLIVKQHASTARDITWAVSSGSIKWCGTEPTWSSDATSAERIVTWRWDGSVMYLAATEVAA